MSDPATLTEAIAQQPLYINIWINFVLAANLGAFFFLLKREEESWKVRIDAVAIILAFFAAAILMNYMYDQMGYVRLLGLAHIVFWTPVYFWIWKRRPVHAPANTLFGKYIIYYLAMNGLSLIIDVIDFVRHFVGI